MTARPTPLVSIAAMRSFVVESLMHCADHIAVIHDNHKRIERATGIRGAPDAAAFEADFANRETAAPSGQLAVPTHSAHSSCRRKCQPCVGLRLPWLAPSIAKDI
jgi:hypothetical protein